MEYNVILHSEVFNFILSISVNIGTRAPVYQIVFLRLCWISDSGATRTLREDYQLICGVSGAENLYPNIAYQWTKNSGNGQTQIGGNSNTLSLLRCNYLMLPAIYVQLQLLQSF